MTESSFKEAFTVFRAMPYPNYPQSSELQDWNSKLLTLDGHVAGYASRIFRGKMNAREIPEPNYMVDQARSLMASLEVIGSTLNSECELVQEYHAYVVALSNLVQELHLLAEGGG